MVGPLLLRLALSFRPLLSHPCCLANFFLHYLKVAARLFLAAVEIGAIGAPLEFNNVSLSAFWSSLLD